MVRPFFSLASTAWSRPAVRSGLAALVLALLAPAAPASAQTVSRVEGSTLTLSLGSRAGVTVGMTGRVCYQEQVGGGSVEVCPAKFAVTEVRETTATAQVTKGDAGAVARGYAARLDQPLAPPRATSTPAPQAPALPAASNDTEALFWSSVKDSSDPDELRMFLRKFPNGTFAELARSRLARLEGGASKPAPAPAAPILSGRAFEEPRSGVRFLPIPAGRFEMGCTSGDFECDSDERPSHAVTISSPFYLAETETTVGQYRRYAQSTGRGMPSSPSFSQGEDHPVVNVSWADAKAFCEWAGGRLPSEAEWEVAARGGLTGGKYPWGNAAPVCRTGASSGARFDDNATCDSEQGSRTAPVKTYAANGYGLNDVSGNVWEWVEDCWHENYSEATGDASAWTSGGDCSQRVRRGGSWNYFPRFLRVSDRTRNTPSNRIDDLGFRCQRTAIP